MQPSFNSWLGYFELIDYVDKFIFLDTVPLNYRSWQTRNKLKVKDKDLLFSIPIENNKSIENRLINNVLIDYRKFDFRIKLFKTIVTNYSKSKHYKDVLPFLEELIFFNTKYLSTYNINIIKSIVEKLDIKTNISILSETNYSSNFKKGELVLDICNFYNANEYISPLGAKEYLDSISNKFSDYKISIYYQDYLHPIYNQVGNLFIPYLGIFDILLNEGFGNSKSIICSGRNYIHR